MICCRESIVSTVRTEELVVHNQFKSNFIWFSLLKSSSSSSQNACDMFQGFTNLIEFIDHLILWTLSLSQTNNSIIIINAQTKLWFNLIQSVFVSDAHHKHTHTHLCICMSSVRVHWNYIELWFATPYNNIRHNSVAGTQKQNNIRKI